MYIRYENLHWNIAEMNILAINVYQAIKSVDNMQGEKTFAELQK